MSNVVWERKKIWSVGKGLWQLQKLRLANALNDCPSSSFLLLFFCEWSLCAPLVLKPSNQFYFQQAWKSPKIQSIFIRKYSTENHRQILVSWLLMILGRGTYLSPILASCKAITQCLKCNHLKKSFLSSFSSRGGVLEAASAAAVT